MSHRAKIESGRRRAAWFAAIAAGVGTIGSARAATWNGGNGNWNSGANWTGGVPNNIAATALIDGGKAGASNVTLDISPIVNTLTVDAGDSLLIGDNRTLTVFAGGGTINGTVTIAAGTNTSALTLNSMQTLSGSGQIVWGGPSFTLGNSINGSGPLTIGPSLTIRTDTQGGKINVNALTNQGLIHNQTSGRVTEIQGNTFLNQGTVRASQGLLFITATSWTNTGTINVSSGGLIGLGGSFTTAGLNLPGLVRTGGSILITGTLDNTGAVLPLTSATGSFALSSGGTLRGGTVTTTSGPQLFVSDSTTGTLDGVNLQALLDVNDGGTLNITNGLNIGANFDLALRSQGKDTTLMFNGPQTLSGGGRVKFDAASSKHFISGSGPLTIGPNITVFNASLGLGGTINVATLTNQGVILAAGEDTTLAITSPAFTNNGTLRAEFSSTMQIASGVSGTGQVFAGPSGTVRAAFIRQDSLQVKGTEGDPASLGHVQINTKAQGGQTSSLKSLTFDLDATSKPLGALDLADTALVLDYTGASPMAAVRAAIISGYANGAWTGPGIRSSVAAANTTRGLGYAEASEVLGATGGTFETQPADGTSVLVRYTLYGDATLDGKVDFNDLVKLAQNYNTTVSTGSESWWARGDFNYDGKADFNDLVKLAQNYNGGLATDPIPGATADFMADLAAAQAPEPSTSAVVLAACGFAGGWSRRRRAAATSLKR